MEMYSHKNIRVCVSLNTKNNTQLSEKFERSKVALHGLRSQKHSPSVDIAKDITLYGSKAIRISKKDSSGVEKVEKMIYDSVWIENKEKQRKEMGLLFNYAITKTRNCSLFRLVDSNECRIQTFYEALVSEIHNQFQSTKIPYQTIKVYYRDIPRDGLNEKSKSQIFKDNNTMDRRGSLVTATDEFEDTIDLLGWLSNNYRKKSTDAAGLTRLELIFTQIGEKKNRRICFNVYIVYLDRLTPPSIDSYFNYLKHLRVSSRENHFLHSALTNELARHLEKQTGKAILIMFEVQPGNPNAIEHFRMADLMGRTRALSSRTRQILDRKRSFTSSTPIATSKSSSTGKKVDESIAKKSKEIIVSGDGRTSAGSTTAPQANAVPTTSQISQPGSTSTRPATNLSTATTLSATTSRSLNLPPTGGESMRTLPPTQSLPRTQRPLELVTHNHENVLASGHCQDCTDDKSLYMLYTKIDNSYNIVRKQVENYLTKAIQSNFAGWGGFLKIFAQTTFEIQQDLNAISTVQYGNNLRTELNNFKKIWKHFCQLEISMSNNFVYKNALRIYFQKKKHDLKEHIKNFKLGLLEKYNAVVPTA